MSCWLPPINSNHSHHISFKVEPSWRNLLCCSSSLESQFAIHAVVSIEYESDDKNNRRIFEGLSWKSKLYFSCGTTISARTLEEHLYIPFEVDKDSMAKCITVVACGMMQKIYAPFVFLLPITVEITKKVEIPDAEFRLWCYWYDLNLKLEPSFKMKYQYEISRPRTKKEIMFEEYMRAKDSGIEEPVIDGLDEDSKTTCPICLETMVVGWCGVHTTSCSHSFHTHCIVRWRAEQHTCPTCPVCRSSYVN